MVKQEMIKSTQKSILLTKPVKMPKGLIYNHPKSCRYHLIETKTGRVIGNMCAFNVEGGILEDNYYKIGSNKNIFHINSLEILHWKRNQGWGKYFIDFAKRESHRQGCEGRTHVVAYNYEKPPQIFYKKQGFVAASEEVNKQLDKHIELGTRPYRWGATDMYLPLDSLEKYKVPSLVPKQKKGFWQIIKDFFF